MIPSYGSRDGEAKLHFTSSGYQIVVPGRYVTCAVTGLRIELDRLRYWSAERQQAYVNGAAALQGIRGERID